MKLTRGWLLALSVMWLAIFALMLWMGLKCFRIETPSTGSVILIYARTWRIEHLSMADAVP